MEKFIIKPYPKDNSYRDDIVNSLMESFNYGKEEAIEEIKINIDRYLIMVTTKGDLIAFLKTREIGKDEISINNVVTVKKYRGSGYGTKFLDYLKEKYKAIELTAIKKYTHEFYAKNGFKTLEEVLRKDFKKKMTPEEYSSAIEEKAEGLWRMRWSLDKVSKKLDTESLSVFNWK